MLAQIKKPENSEKSEVGVVKIIISCAHSAQIVTKDPPQRDPIDPPLGCMCLKVHKQCTLKVLLNKSMNFVVDQ